MDIWLIALSAIATWVALDGHAILRGLANIPVAAPFDDNVVGAHALPFAVAGEMGLPHVGAVGLQVVLLAVMLGVATELARRMRLHRLDDVEATFLLIGCALLVSCFLLVDNIAYRAVHCLFVLPGLTALAWRGTAWLIVVLMWHSGLSVGINAVAHRFGASAPQDEMLHLGIWLAHEAAWWTVITMLAALLIRLVWESRAAREFTALLFKA